VIVFALSTGHELGLGLVGLAFVLYALVSSMVVPRLVPDFPGRYLSGFVLLTICFFAAMLSAVFFFGRESKAAPAAAAAPATTAPSSGASAATIAVGKHVFATAGCTGCHTLKAAGATGTVGPNLDRLKPSAARVARQVSSGGKIMPSFKAKLSAAQIQAVAAYVSSVAGA